MAQIDVTELLADPDFTDPVIIINRTPTVNDFGENILTEEIQPTIGSVQPASGRVLQRLPEALRVQNVSSFWVRGVIIADASATYPDILCFRGKRYEVQRVFDWTNWGAGWSEGVCIVERPAG